MAHIPTPLAELRKIHNDQCEVTFAVREHAGAPSHKHDTTNHVIVTEGTLYLTQDGIERAIGAGQWCTIPAGTPHAERFEEKTSVIVFWMKVA